MNPAANRPTGRTSPNGDAEASGERTMTFEALPDDESPEAKERAVPEGEVVSRDAEADAPAAADDPDESAATGAAKGESAAEGAPADADAGGPGADRGTAGAGDEPVDAAAAAAVVAGGDPAGKREDAEAAGDAGDAEGPKPAGPRGGDPESAGSGPSGDSRAQDAGERDAEDAGDRDTEDITDEADEADEEQTSVIPVITDEAAGRVSAARETAGDGAENPDEPNPGRPAAEQAGRPDEQAASSPAGQPSAAKAAEPAAPADPAGPARQAVPGGAPDAGPRQVRAEAEPRAAAPGTGAAASAAERERPAASAEPAPRAHDPAPGSAVSGPGPHAGPAEPEPEPRPGAGPAMSGPGDPRVRAPGGPGAAGPQGSGRRWGMREVPVPEPVSRAFSAALAELRESIIGLNFGLDLPGAAEARKVQAEILSQLGNYVIPRVHVSTAPALIVVAGSTGAGKSTLVNSLAGAKISATGVRRPTTGTPVLVCHPDDRDWYARGSVLSGLTRVTRPGLAPSASSFVLTSSPYLPQNVALLDTPDIDSAVEEHHEIAHRMLDVADLWVFVTTAARYADAPSWHLLKLAKERGARLAIVLSRVEPRAREVVLKHFGRMLADYGLGDVDRFVIHETTVTDGRLPDEEISELRTWLAELSVDDDRRMRAVRSTLEGALNSFRVRIPALARQLEAQVAFRAELRTDVDAAYMAALAEIDEATRNGSLLRGEVLARWQDCVGSGDIRNALHLRRPGRFAGKTRQEAPIRLRALKRALGSGLESIIIAAAQRAAEDVVTRWRNRSPVGERLAATPGLGKASEELVRRAGQAVSAWQDHLTELVRTEGVTKRSIARVLSIDVDSLAVILAVGLLGYEFSDTATAAAGSLPERLLRGLLGAESLRNIAAKARSDLRARINMLFDEETVRHVHVLDSAGIPDESAATRLYQATYNLEVAR